MNAARPSLALFAMLAALGLVGYWFRPLPRIGAGPGLPASCRAGDAQAVMRWGLPAAVYVCAPAAVFVPTRERGWR